MSANANARVVIVGASVGGVRAAQELRGNGFTGTLTLIEAENHLPYDKPPLSKAVLEGSADVESIAILNEDQFRDLDIDLRLGRSARRLDLEANTVHLDDGSAVPFDELIIATGARARTAPWTDVPGVRTMRNLDDAHHVKEDFARGGHVVVCGAGFIGSEAASVARKQGLDVTIIDPLEVPMGRIFGDEIGHAFTELHQAHGVRTLLGRGISAIAANDGVFRVDLTDGTSLTGDSVLVGIGAVPNTEWLEDSGLQLDNGVVCDENLTAVGHPHVHAIGDLARWSDPVRGVTRIEHWGNASDQAAHVARVLTGSAAPQPFVADGYVWSDQYDWHIQLIGRFAGAFDHIERVDDVLGTSLAALYLDAADEVVGLLTVNAPRAIMSFRRRLRTGAPLGRDEAVALLEKARPKTHTPGAGA